MTTVTPLRCKGVSSAIFLHRLEENTWAPSMEQPTKDVFRCLRRGTKIFSSFQDYQDCPKGSRRLITFRWAAEINRLGHTINNVSDISKLYERQIEDRSHQLACRSARACRCNESRYSSPNPKPIVLEADFASSSLTCRPKFVQSAMIRRDLENTTYEVMANMAHDTIEPSLSERHGNSASI